MKNKRQGELKTRLTSQAGVSLLEVMLLVFLLGGALLAGFTALRANISATSAESQTGTLANVDRVLTGFIATYNRLPCPDVDGDGVEDCGSPAQKGRLPYRTIGLGGAEGMAGKGSLGYLIQRSSVDLTTAMDTWQPIKFKNNTES